MPTSQSSDQVTYTHPKFQNMLTKLYFLPKAKEPGEFDYEMC